MILIFLFLLIPQAHGHVSFLFPTARFPPLDYLDSTKTKAPCGVPRPPMPKYTNLQVGTVYNISWRMPFQHEGGYRINLLNKNGTLIEQLSPLDGMTFTPDEDGVTYERIRFTNPCENCILQLERQALEWSEVFLLYSCADINIVSMIPADCNTNDDCLNGGKCVKEEDSLIQKVCYCSYGYFGRRCQFSESEIFSQKQRNFKLVSKLKSDDCFGYEELNDMKYESYGMFNPNCYNLHELNTDDRIYYRSIQNDVEVILDFASGGWVSMGWRPEGLDPSCRLFPDLEHGAPVPVFKREKRKSDAPPKYIEQEGPRPEMPRDNGFLPSTLRAPLHPMDCMDMIIGRFKNGRGRVEDSYSRDRSTPLEDYWYDGEMSLSAAYSLAHDGRTILMFRRMQQEIEPTDHPLGPNRVFVGWAKGPSMHLSYHGPKSRGIAYIDFTVPVKPSKPREDKAFGVHIAKNIFITPPPQDATKRVTTTQQPTEAETKPAPTRLFTSPKVADLDMEQDSREREEEPPDEDQEEHLHHGHSHTHKEAQTDVVISPNCQIAIALTVLLVQIFL
ncbi:hypothetical protein WR25_18621 [Diploscapter pachys]|uniref:EGF-like domain-containing protein n=1 Tax=Diploscapter pachys TaxID=2018661 RepID=A0A2A2LMN9_9BILA|nr:hypothetical protein WR25_18621 [Diploscapter pachys]